MTTAIEFMLWIIVLLVAVPAAVFTLETLAALLPTRKASAHHEHSRPPLTVLIPAHNEEALVGHTVSAAQTQLRPDDTILVVADNCSDATAAEASRAGAMVLERDDPENRGKGFALAAGVKHLKSHEPEIVIIIDADCEPEPGALDWLATHASARGRPVQAAYLMRPPRDAGVGDRVSALAFRFKNLIRPRGLRRLGLPCLLTGSGMAFPYKLLADAELATGDIVEDMRLGVDLAIQGFPPVADSQATIWSVLPGSGEARVSQRTRWEHGHLASIMAHTPRLMWSSLTQARPALLGLALELMVPPMSLLMLLTAATAATSTILWVFTTNGGPAVGAWSVLAMTCLACVIGWVRFGRDTLRARDVVAIPFYVLGKIPIYLRAVTARQKSWVRTQRDDLDQPG